MAPDITFVAANFVRILELSSTVVEADFFELFASDIKLLVKLACRLVKRHQLIERANFELSFVNLSSNNHSPRSFLTFTLCNSVAPGLVSWKARICLILWMTASSDLYLTTVG